MQNLSTILLTSEHSSTGSQDSFWIQSSIFCLASVVNGLEIFFRVVLLHGLDESEIGVAYAMLWSEGTPSPSMSGWIGGLMNIT